RRLCRREPAHRRTDHEKDESDQPTGDVEPVKPGGQVEHGTVAVTVDLGAFADQVPVLVALPQDERQPHHESQEEPAAQRVHIAAKNISSLESHTIVPTLTMLGRVNE